MTDTQKPEALLWATYLESIFVSETITAPQARKIAAELRRLQAENEALRAAIAQSGMTLVKSGDNYHLLKLGQMLAGSAEEKTPDWRAGLWRYGFTNEHFGLQENGPYVLVEQVDAAMKEKP